MESIKHTKTKILTREDVTEQGMQALEAVMHAGNGRPLLSFALAIVALLEADEMLAEAVDGIATHGLHAYWDKLAREQGGEIPVPVADA